MKRINTYITEQQSERLLNLTTKTGIRFSEQIRRALDLYLEKMEKKEKNERIDP